jgi:hypothetical protein
MRRPLVWLAIAVAALALLVAYLVLASGPLAPFAPTRTITDPAKIQTMALGFVNDPYKDDYDIWRLSGYLDNLSRSTIVAAHLDVQLLDSNGNKKELVKYTVRDVLPGKRKSFDADAGMLSGPRKATATITSLVVTR